MYCKIFFMDIIHVLSTNVELFQSVVEIIHLKWFSENEDCKMEVLNSIGSYSWSERKSKVTHFWKDWRGWRQQLLYPWRMCAWAIISGTLKTRVLVHTLCMENMCMSYEDKGDTQDKGVSYCNLKHSDIRSVFLPLQLIDVGLLSNVSRRIYSYAARQQCDEHSNGPPCTG